MSDPKKPSFTPIPQDILLNTGISTAAKILYCFIGRDLWKKNVRTTAITNAELVKLAADVKLRSIQRYIKQLKDAGLIEVQERKKVLVNGKWVSTGEPRRIKILGPNAALYVYAKTPKATETTGGASPAVAVDVAAEGGEGKDVV